MLERYHALFRRAGAGLDAAAKERLKEIGDRLASLGTTFGQNVLADEQAYVLPLADDDLAGLPDFARDAARGDAEERGLAGHAVTLSRSSVEPFLQFSARRELREKAFRAWIARGDNGGATDNNAIIAELTALRDEKARLLGYPSFADYRLDDTMAKTPAAVTGLLDAVWAPARRRVARSATPCRRSWPPRAATSASRRGTGATTPRSCARRASISTRARSSRTCRSRRIIEAAFYTANRLFGLTFTPRSDVPVYHPDVRVWEVTGPDGRHVGVFFGDYFARPSKRSGAWMTSLRDQERLDGEVRPLVLNVMNFNKGAKGEPTLLSFDDARTLFHEFGHGLHGLMSEVTYPMISGTGVLQDFVELPSQLYEHWLDRPEILERFARHYKTGEPMPRALMDRLHRLAHLQPGLPHHRIPRLELRRPRLPSRWREGRPQGGSGDARADADARRGRAAPPPAALRAHLLGRRLCGRLLQLSVVRSAGRGRVQRLRGDRRRVRPGRRRAACATTSMRPAAPASRPRPTRPSAAGCPRSIRCCASAGLWTRRRSSAVAIGIAVAVQSRRTA